jgi:hypothetical protein
MDALVDFPYARTDDAHPTLTTTRKRNWKRHAQLFLARRQVRREPLRS